MTPLHGKRSRHPEELVLAGSDLSSNAVSWLQELCTHSASLCKTPKQIQWRYNNRPTHFSILHKLLPIRVVQRRIIDTKEQLAYATFVIKLSMVVMKHIKRGVLPPKG